MGFFLLLLNNAFADGLGRCLLVLKRLRDKAITVLSMEWSGSEECRTTRLQRVFQLQANAPYCITWEERISPVLFLRFLLYGLTRI